MDLHLTPSEIRLGAESTATGHIQHALDTCAESGGGTVRLASGQYLCGTLRLHGNVRLHLEYGAHIKGVPEPRLYPVLEKRSTPDKPPLRALVVADGCHRAAITGSGTIDGGAVDTGFWQKAADMRLRAALCFFRDCTDVRIEGITLQNTLFWTLHLLRCSGVSIRGLSIRCRQKVPNADGIDPDGCRNVIIGDCSIQSDDDCIVVKSTEGDVCENITVSNCVLSSGASGLKVGTETVGAIRRISVTNCVIHDSNMGLTLFSKDGGTLEKMIFQGLHLQVRAPFPLLIDVTPRAAGAAPPGPIRDITIRDATVAGRGRCIIEGLDTVPVRNVLVDNLSWEITDSYDRERTTKPAGSSFVSDEVRRRLSYADPYHFFVSRVDGIAMNAVRLAMGDGVACDRKAALLSDVSNHDLRFVETVGGPRGVSVEGG